MPEYRMPPALSSCPRYADALHAPKPFLMPVQDDENQQQQQPRQQIILPPVKVNLKIRFSEEILVTEIEDRFYYSNNHNGNNSSSNLSDASGESSDGECSDDDSYEIEIVEDDGEADFYLEIVDGEVFYVFETEDDISVDSNGDDSATADNNSMEENIDAAIMSRSGGGEAMNNSFAGGGSSDEDEYDEETCTGHDSSYFSGDKSMSSMDQSVQDMNFSFDDMAAPDLDDSDTSVELEATTAESNKQSPQVQVIQQEEATAARTAAATPCASASEDAPPAVINVIEMEPEDGANQQQDEAMPDAAAAAAADATEGLPRTTEPVVSKVPPTKPVRQPSLLVGRSGSGLKELRASMETIQNLVQDSQAQEQPMALLSEEPASPLQEPAPAPAQPQDNPDGEADEKPCDEIGGEHIAGASTQDGDGGDIVSSLAPPKMSVAKQQAKQENVHHASPSSIATPVAAIATGVGSPPLMTSPPLSPSKFASPGKSILRANPPSPRKKKPSGTKRDKEKKDKDKKKAKTFTKTYVRPEEFDGEHRVYSWEKPDWAKKDGGETKQLRSTGKGDDIRKGANLANPITFCIKGPVNPGVEEDDEKAGTKVSIADITAFAPASAATDATPTTTAAAIKRAAGGMDIEEVMRRLNAGERVAAAGVPYYRKNQRQLRISINGAKIRDGADIVKPITMATVRTSEDAILNKVANQNVLKTTTTGQEVREGKNLAAPVTMPIIKFDDTNHVANKNVLKNKGVAPKTNKQYEWEKPEWTQRSKLKSTVKGDAVKQGMDLQAPITQIGRYRSFNSLDSDSSRGRSSADCNIATTNSDDDNNNDNDGGGGCADPLDQVCSHERRHLLTEVKVHEWEKPTWTKNKPLTPSSKGLALKKGESLARPITFPHRRPNSTVAAAAASEKVAPEEQPQHEQDGKLAS
jgi:hypothetical protein